MLVIFLLRMDFSEAVCYYQVSLNVGTVLYSPTDKAKPGWTRDELALLQARRHAQNLLPPTDVNEQINEQYIKNLLDYFKAIYKTVKKESPDGQVSDIMTTAISDTLGGYLKVWVLPITKFAFYSGTVSKDSAGRIFNFYDDIKKYLKTDGRGWHEPDLKVLKSVAINIAPAPKISYTLNTNFPCDNLVYFEKTDNGLKIPIPTINWENNTGTIFLPLKNQSLISLHSPDSTNALFKYYDAAKRCLSYARVSDEDEFNKRFQSWLINNVLPHLNDENLYFGLDSVLCLVNKTKELNGKVSNLHNKIIKTTSLHSEFPQNYVSKKVIIVTIVLFLEICWCIPAMVYIKFSKDKRKKRRRNNSFTDVCVSYREKPSITDSTMDDNSTRTKPYDDKGMKLYQKPRPRYLDFETKTASTGLNDELRMKSSSIKFQFNTDPNTNITKVGPYCYDCASNTSIFTSPSGIIRPVAGEAANKLTGAKTVTLFKSNKQNKKNSDEAQLEDKVPTSSNKTKSSRHLKNVSLKETPVVFKEPSKYASIIRYKKSKKKDNIDNSKTDKNENWIKYAPTSNDSKTNQIEKAPKNKRIIFSHKGAKGNAGQNIGIKIERPETETVHLSDGNDKSKVEIAPRQMIVKNVSEFYIPSTIKEIKEASQSTADCENVAQNLKKEITNDRFLETIKSEEDSELITKI